MEIVLVLLAAWLVVGVCYSCYSSKNLRGDVNAIITSLKHDGPWENLKMILGVIVWFCIAPFMMFDDLWRYFRWRLT